jgi:hypothetical protein
MVASAMVVASHALAAACDCEWPPYEGQIDSIIYQISHSDVVFEGVPVAYRLVERGGKERFAELTFRVTRCVKGNCTEHLALRSWGGDQGANCGMASNLNVPAPSKQHYWVAGSQSYPNEVPEQGVVWINGCGGLFQHSEPTPPQGSDSQ